MECHLGQSGSGLGGSERRAVLQRQPLCQRPEGTTDGPRKGPAPAGCLTLVSAGASPPASQRRPRPMCVISATPVPQHRGRTRYRRCSADVRHAIEREADVAAPGVLDPIARDLRMHFERPAQDGRRPLDRRRHEAGAAAEDHPPLGSDVPVVEEVLRVEEGAAFGESSRARSSGIGSRRDDVAPDRDDPAPQPRHDADRCSRSWRRTLAAATIALRRLDDESAVGLRANGSRGRPRAGRHPRARRPGESREDRPGGSGRRPRRRGRRSSMLRPSRGCARAGRSAGETPIDARLSPRPLEVRARWGARGQSRSPSRGSRSRSASSAISA